MAMGGKICLLILLVSIAVVLGTQDPELKQCRHRCKVQKQFDESEKSECMQECDRYIKEKQRREREEGGRGGLSIFDADDENPRKSPVEKLGECESQCEQQRKQGQHGQERQQEQQYQRCQKECFDEFKREQRQEGQGGLSNFDADDESPRKSPVEKLGECESQCEQQRKQGQRGQERQQEQQYQRCQKECFDEFKHEQRQEGQGGGTGRDNYIGREQEREQEQEQEQEERGEGEKNPYVFQDQHFSAQLKSEHGSLRILQKFTERSNLLRGIENFRVAILEADPQTFLVPNHFDADILFFVAQGRGTLSLVRPEKRESFNIKRGDVVRVPAGITSYIINRDNNQKLVLAKLLRPVSTPGNFEAFYGPGGDNPESFYKAFSTEILEAAFNTRKDTLQKIFGQQRKGFIVKASEEQIRALSRHEEGGHWPFGGESKGPFNLLEKRPQISNKYGRLHAVDADEVRQLEDLDVSVSFMNITQGGMAGPTYHSKATKIAIVLNGEGYFEMACPHLSQQRGGSSGRQQTTTTGKPSYQKVSSRLRRGVVFVIPSGHPVTVVASNNQNLEYIGFEVNAKNNERVPLVGKNNVISQFEREAIELAFGVPSKQVQEVFRSQEEELFFKGPRQQGRAEM